MNQVDYVIRRSSLRPFKAPLLSHLDIELTERCNNACLHCYINQPASSTRVKNNEFSTAQWQEVLRQAADLGSLSIRFTGGEPLLREDFKELYLFARRIGMKVTLFTNARCITTDIADMFARVPALEPVEITVYGMRSETYDTVACAPGAYEEFRQGVQNLIDRGVPFILKGALLPQNKNDMEALDGWAAEIPWMKSRPGYALFFDLRARRDSVARNRMIESLRVPAEDGVLLLDQRSQDYRKGMQQFCSQFMGPKGDQLFGCGAGQAGCVDAYGQYQPCMLLRDPSLKFDLRTGSIKEALTEFFPRLKDMRATNPRYLERCGRCFLHGLCEQCPAKSWMEHGTLDTPVEYLCEVAHAKARYIGLLQDGEKAWEVENWQQRLALLKNGEAQ